MSLTKAQQTIIKLATKKEEIYDVLEKLNEKLDEALKETGVDSMFQDPETKIVYKVIEPAGRFVSFSKIDVKRTNKLGENRGGTALSKKEATEAGFEL